MLKIIFVLIGCAWILGGIYDFARGFNNPVPRGEEGAGIVVAFLGIALISAILE